MEPSTANALIAGIVGLITGAVGSLIAPWMNWGVEKKRKKYERRTELIQSWRKILSNKNFQRGDLLNDPSYGPLRDLLQEKTISEIEKPSNHITVVLNSPTENHDRDLIIREIAHIEKSWKLI